MTTTKTVKEIGFYDKRKIVRYVAGTFFIHAGVAVMKEDLYQAGWVGILKCEESKAKLNRKPTRNEYYNWVRCYMQKEVAFTYDLIRIPQWAREQFRKHMLGSKCKLTKEELLHIKNILFMTLDYGIHSIYEKIYEYDKNLEFVEIKEIFEKVLKEANVKERYMNILLERVVEGKKLKEISAKEGISKQRIFDIVQKTIKKIKYTL